MSENIFDPYLPPVYVSNYMWELKKKPVYKNRADILETLYLINIDPSSLMGSDLLYKVVPLTNWDGSKYKQIYKSYCRAFDNNYISYANQDEFLKNLSGDRKKLLLNCGNDKDISDLALNITSGYTNILDKANAVQKYLKENYYYSLKPGFAKDGNQLKYFLFESKKGYCSYFAFAMALMLKISRSCIQSCGRFCSGHE